MAEKKTSKSELPAPTPVVEVAESEAPIGDGASTEIHGVGGEPPENLPITEELPIPELDYRAFDAQEALKRKWEKECDPLYQYIRDNTDIKPETISFAYEVKKGGELHTFSTYHAFASFLRSVPVSKQTDYGIRLVWNADSLEQFRKAHIQAPEYGVYMPQNASVDFPSFAKDLLSAKLPDAYIGELNEWTPPPPPPEQSSDIVYAKVEKMKAARARKKLEKESEIETHQNADLRWLMSHFDNPNTPFRRSLGIFKNISTGEEVTMPADSGLGDPNFKLVSLQLSPEFAEILSKLGQEK
jgi:hypothetical protein